MPQLSTAPLLHELMHRVIPRFPDVVVAYTDGASRGNPGPAAAGVVILTPQGKPLYEYAKKIGFQTNNFAEYTAVIEALKVCTEGGAKSVIVRADSQLMVRQMTGEYRVKSEIIAPLHKELTALVKLFARVDFEHVRREENIHADKLANQALDGEFEH
jgi:ribonuclease HI